MCGILTPHVVDFYGKCRLGNYTIHGLFGIGKSCQSVLHSRNVQNTSKGLEVSLSLLFGLGGYKWQPCRF